MPSFHQQQVSPRGPRPCAAGCSFFGSPETLDMCSACYKKHCLAAEPGANNSAAAAAPRSAVAAAALIGTPPASSTAAKPVADDVSFLAPAAVVVAEAAAVVQPSSAPPGAAAKKAQPTRCAACYRKVGLTGFVCRCKKTFCGTHRYAEEHGCSFDFKGAGRNAIARNNPLVKGEKLPGKI